MRRTRPGTGLLILGVVMVGVLLILAFAGPALAPYALDYSEKLLKVPTDDGFEYVYAPQPPDTRHPMGTDRWGYDILTLVLHGARYTIGAGLLIALARIVIGGGLGLYLGVRREGGELRPSSTILAGVPGFVLIFFVMAGINYDSPLSPPTLALVQGFFMTVLGLPAVAAAVANKSRTIKRSPHITAAVATGAGGRRIASRHVLPLMREDLLQMLAHEMVLVLTLLGQLAIFDLFFGGTERTWDPPAFWAVTHEWAGMVGQERIAILANQWLLLGPLFAFAFAILAFQFVATGLERRGRAGYARSPFV